MTWTMLITFLVATLSGLGVGSAGLLVVWMTLVKDTPQLVAQGLNLVFFILSSGAAFVIHLFRTPILWRCLLFLIPFGVIGSFLGTGLSSLLPQTMLRRIFGVMLILSGTMGLSARKKR